MSTTNENPSILLELLDTPVFKDILRDYLANIDPRAGGEIVKTLLWKDPELVFSLVGALPVMINAAVGTANEAGRQLATFPPELIRSLGAKVARDIDRDQIIETMRGFADLTKPLLSDNVPDPARLAGVGLDLLAEGIIRADKSDPEFFDNFASRVLDPVDKKNLGEALGVLFQAFLNQRIPLRRWLFRQVSARFRHRKRY